MSMLSEHPRDSKEQIIPKSGGLIHTSNIRIWEFQIFDDIGTIYYVRQVHQFWITGNQIICSPEHLCFKPSTMNAIFKSEGMTFSLPSSQMHCC